MQRPWNRLVFSRFVAFLVVLLLAVPAAAEWFKDYEAAMDMVKKGQWDAAAPKLRSAISQKNEEGSNIKFYGMKFADYFPHYYLGMAYFSQKNYEAALREFQQSESFGAIQKKGDLYGKLTNSKTLAAAQIALAKPPEIPTTKPPVTQTPPTTVATQTPAQQTADEKKIVELPKVTPEAKKPATTPPTTPPFTPPVNLTVEEAKLMVKEGARKYFEGDYDAAINFLVNAVEKKSADPVAQFLLGCSYASKYLVSGSQDDELYQNALASFYKVRALRPGYRPRETAFFSPAVLRIYAKTG